MYIFVFLYTHTYVHTYTHIHVYAYIHTYMHNMYVQTLVVICIAFSSGNELISSKLVSWVPIGRPYYLLLQQPRALWPRLGPKPIFGSCHVQFLKFHVLFVSHVFSLCFVALKSPWGGAGGARLNQSPYWATSHAFHCKNTYD